MQCWNVGWNVGAGGNKPSLRASCKPAATCTHVQYWTVVNVEPSATSKGAGETGKGVAGLRSRRYRMRPFKKPTGKTTTKWQSLRSTPRSATCSTRTAKNNLQRRVAVWVVGVSIEYGQEGGRKKSRETAFPKHFAKNQGCAIVHKRAFPLHTIRPDLPTQSVPLQ